jgi:hypothetical protein
VDINECSSSPCRNGGACNNRVNSFTCDCKPGYTGTTCATNINECSSNPCVNGGSCTDGVNDFTCSCPAGYQGKRCEVNIDECASNPCLNNAVRCNDLVNDYLCECRAGFNGKRCENNIDECAGGSKCANGGTCTDGINSFTCSCATGYTGTTCATNIDECASDPCVQGTCRDGVNGFTCACNAGWTGTLCNVKINYCAANPCDNGFTCACNAGWTGTLCNVKINYCAANPCDNGGTCTSLETSYRCTCPPGYTGNRCQTNIDECASSPCRNGGTCNDGVAKFTCTCPSNYAGALCADDVNECSSAQLNTCSANADCISRPGTYDCACKPGYTGDGRTCTEVNECSSNPCANGGTCADRVNGFICICPPGFTGPTCATNIDECGSNPCANGGTCTDGIDDFSCSCAAGYEGKVCDGLPCPILTAPAQGDVATSNDNRYPSVASFSCVAGYEVIGETSLDCTTGALWDAPSPTCSACAAEEYKSATAGDTRCAACPSGSTTEGEEAQAACYCRPGHGGDASTGMDCAVCAVGYYKADVGNRACDACDPGYTTNGEGATVCVGRRCDTLVAPAHGALDILNGGLYPSTATVMCERGYALISSSAASINCTTAGTWGAPVPLCNPICGSAHIEGQDCINATRSRCGDQDNCKSDADVGPIIAGAFCAVFLLLIIAVVARRRRRKAVMSLKIGSHPAPDHASRAPQDDDTVDMFGNPMYEQIRCVLSTRDDHVSGGLRPAPVLGAIGTRGDMSSSLKYLQVQPMSAPGLTMPQLHETPTVNELLSNPVYNQTEIPHATGGRPHLGAGGDNMIVNPVYLHGNHRDIEYATPLQHDYDYGRTWEDPDYVEI